MRIVYSLIWAPENVLKRRRGFRESRFGPGVTRLYEVRRSQLQYNMNSSSETHQEPPEGHTPSAVKTKVHIAGGYLDDMLPAFSPCVEM